MAGSSGERGTSWRVGFGRRPSRRVRTTAGRCVRGRRAARCHLRECDLGPLRRADWRRVSRRLRRDTGLRPGRCRLACGRRRVMGTPRSRRFVWRARYLYPTASGPSMADVAAREGRVVIAGSLTLGRDPAVWWSDDLNEWHMIEVGATGQSQPTAIAASERGFAMVGIAYGSTGTRDSAAGWFSTDGLTWVPATFEDGAGSRVGMSSQRKTDGSLPDRWEPLLRSGPLATDSNGDGPMSSRPRALRFDSRRFSLSSHSTGTLSATEVPTVRATLGSRVSAAGSRRRGPLNRPYGSRATAGDGPRSARLPIASTR